jgi:hypothetical protein
MLKKFKQWEVDDATSQAGDQAARCQKQTAMSCVFGFRYTSSVLVRMRKDLHVFFIPALQFSVYVTFEANCKCLFFLNSIPNLVL